MLPPRKPSVLTFATRPQRSDITRRDHAWLLTFCSFTLSSGYVPSLVDSRPPFLASLHASCGDIQPRPVDAFRRSILLLPTPRWYLLPPNSQHTGLHLSPLSPVEVHLSAPDVHSLHTTSVHTSLHAGSILSLRMCSRWTAAFRTFTIGHGAFVFLYAIVRGISEPCVPHAVAS